MRATNPFVLRATNPSVLRTTNPSVLSDAAQRRSRRTRFALLVAALVAVSGCAWFDGDPPDRSCRTDNDCFRAQGERCDQTARVCVIIDAGEFVAPDDPAGEPTEPSVPEVAP